MGGVNSIPKEKSIKLRYKNAVIRLKTGKFKEKSRT